MANNTGIPTYPFYDKLYCYSHITILHYVGHRDLEESEKLDAIASATRSASKFSQVNTPSSLQDTARQEKLLDFKGVPLCHHRGDSVVGNDVSIYYPGFHTFASQCENIAVDGSDCKFAFQLCLAMKKTYECEEDRRKEFVKLLGEYIDVQFCISKHGEPKADFYIPGKVYCEVKNEPGSTNSDPYREVISYYCNSVVKSSSFPCFLLELSGASLTISGAVYGESIYVDRLVPPIWLVNEEMNSKSSERIVRTLKAFKVAVLRLISTQVTPVEQPRFPCFQLYVGEDKVERKIKYLKEIKPHLFEGMVDEKCVVIKYTEQYNADVHQLLADNELAPKLLVTRQIGRFTAVVMIKLENAINIEEFLIKHPERKPALLDQCKKVLQLLATNNFVHGDLRPCNLLVSEGQVYVTDFDWAGIENEVKYPLYLNHSEISWPNGVASDGLKITSEHDKYWIDQLESLSAGPHPMLPPQPLATVEH